jgi:predicted ATP-grasp superfamily ATP-dependent carboligase
MTSLLICGASTRAVADSAARAGFSVTALDAFADLDQHPAVRAISVVTSGNATASALARSASSVDGDAVVYLSPFENHPRAVARIAAGRQLWGNAPDTLRAVRDPGTLARVSRLRGFAFPRMSRNSNDPNDSYLLKPFRSGGGNRIRPWRGEPVPRTSYLQEQIEGTSGSLAFVAAAGDCVPVGFSRQLAGEPSFGACGFRYCGNIVAPLDDRQFSRGRALLDAATTLARAVTSEFDLVGLNGIDFIARDGVPVLLEVNPRWSSSMELSERAFATTLFQAHADACRSSTLPSFDLISGLRLSGAFGKAIVYARKDSLILDSAGWLDDPDVRDVPRSGQRFRPGQPVCSVFATAPDSDSCYRELVARAECIYRQLEESAPFALSEWPGRIVGCAN